MQRDRRGARRRARRWRRRAALGARLGPVDGRRDRQSGISDGRCGRRRQPRRRAAAGDRARGRTARALERLAARRRRARARRASTATAIIVSPLDTYVSGRMITLAAPCKALMEKDPLTVTADYLLADISEQIKESHYGAAVVVDSGRQPVGLLTRSDLVAPPRRRVILVDHAEQAQSVPGIERGRDRRDPRPPPHRLDRDPGAGHGDLRPGRLDRNAGRRALPPERDGAQPTPPR